MKRARIASLPAAAADLLDGERRAIVEWSSTPDGKPVAGCVISATRASDGTPMLDVMDCDPAMRVRVVWDNLARMAISDAALDRALAVMGYRPAYPSEHERAVKRKEMRAAIEVAVYGEPQGLSASRTLAAAGEIVDNALARETPPCAASMGCLCAGHARGNPASTLCDTSETAPVGSCEVCGRDDVFLTPDGKLVNHDAGDPIIDPYESCAGSGQVPAAPEHEDVTYVCACSWVGGDPDKFRGVWVCPACRKHGGKHVPVAATAIDNIDVTREVLKAVMAYRGSYVHLRGLKPFRPGYMSIWTGVYTGKHDKARPLVVGAPQAIVNACVAAFARRRALNERSRK